MVRNVQHDPRAFEDLPGYDLVREGLDDLDHGDPESVPALLVAIGSPRLREIGLRGSTGRFRDGAPRSDPA